MEDPYVRLRPWTHIEACECPTLIGLLLVDVLGANPVHCEQCRKEVAPERLQLSAREIDAIAAWQRVAHALYMLWLDSGEYESYAKRCMLDLDGAVNRAGRAVARMLSTKAPTRVWLFHDPDDGAPTQCPCCHQPLASVAWGTGRCMACAIHL